MTDLNQLPEKKKMDIKPTQEVENVMVNGQSFEKISTTNQIPHEIIDLPSKGLLYPPGSELSKGQIKMKYMTAKEEDILTNQTLIKKGTVLDELFKSLIVSHIDYGDLLIGDKNAIIVWSRILSYGAQYDIQVTTPSGKTQEVTVNLEELKTKQIDESLITPGQNIFKFTTPRGKNEIEFKLLTNKDQWEIDNRIAGLKKIGQQSNLTVRLRQMILSVDGNSDKMFINDFINTRFLAMDSRAFRQYIEKVQPDIDMTIELTDEETGEPFRSNVTVGLDFFWPDAQI